MRRVVRLSNFRGRRHSTAAQPQLNVLIRERTEGAVCSDTGLTYASKYDCALLDGATVLDEVTGWAYEYQTVTSRRPHNSRRTTSQPSKL